MKKHRTIVKRLVVVFALLITSAFFVMSVSAQDINLDNMDDEQLMLLMQAISQKLQKNEESAGEGSDTVTNEPSAADQAKGAEDTDQKTLRSSDPSGVSEKQVTRAIDAKKYQIYENKKLIIGRMPDSMFVRKPTGDGGGEEEPVPEDPKTPEEEHSCPGESTYGCYTDRYGWTHCGCANG